MEFTQIKEKLDHLYETYNQREYVDPDPLLFLYNYPDKKNREIVGFIAAGFAYGRVEMIMKTVGHVLERLGIDPFRYLMEKSIKDMKNEFIGVRHRFANEDHLVNLLWGIRKVIFEFSSLENCFYEGMGQNDDTVLSGLQFLSDQIRGKEQIGHLLADPAKKSACKRSHLFLRWMVRNDAVDPGGWDQVPSSKLIVPVDRHMHTSGVMLGFTSRKTADLKTALEITGGFKKITPQDPVKYDFCLTRFGIRRDLDMKSLEKMVNN
ncbi:MAG: TIGR02757 family protein [Desulfobacula sp.]|nr:TIGR02757 family protein [Desulfobacula sp.]